jgi:hypothetical protein
MKIADAPMNKQTSPAIMRCEIATDVANVLVVMSPSVRPVKANTLILCGRSPDLRVDGLKAPSQFPSGINFKTSPLTVAGAVTVLAPFGSSSPYSLLGPSHIVSGHRTVGIWQVFACAVNSIPQTKSEFEA